MYPPSSKQCMIMLAFFNSCACDVMSSAYDCINIAATPLKRGEVPYFMFLLHLKFRQKEVQVI